MSISEVKNMFLKNANNPQSASAVAVSTLLPQAAKIKLENLGVTVLDGYKPPNPVSSVSFHIDTNFVHIKDNVFVVSKASYEYYKKLFEKTDAKIICGESGGIGEYPLDAAYNVAIVGKFAVLNEKYADKILLEVLYKNGFEIINTKQGYAKCSVCVVDENSLITDDTSIYKSCSQKGLDVLLTEKGDVNLVGFDYGFIGGCSGKISKDTLVFCGNVDLHRNAKEIKEFCRLKGVNVLSLGDFPLCDVGGIVPVFEK